jgi:ribosome-associated translation inhibitor RaiA
MVRIRRTGKHFDIGEALPRHARERHSAPVEHPFQGHPETDVIFMTEKTGFRTDCDVPLSSGTPQQAHNSRRHDWWPKTHRLSRAAQGAGGLA